MVLNGMKMEAVEILKYFVRWADPGIWLNGEGVSSDFTYCKGLDSLRHLCGSKKMSRASNDMKYHDAEKNRRQSAEPTLRIYPSCSFFLR